MIEQGKKAPAFRLPDQDGKIHSLSDYEGQWVLLYFYPKDDTPGCTKEACGIRDNWSAFKKLNIQVFGVSADSPKSHTKFADKYNLPFTLLADEEKKTATKYGAWGEKKMMGRSYMGMKRVSFLIDPNGNIAKVYKTVKPPEHAEQVLKDLRAVIIATV